MLFQFMLHTSLLMVKLYFSFIVYIQQRSTASFYGSRDNEYDQSTSGSIRQMRSASASIRPQYSSHCHWGPGQMINPRLDNDEEFDQTRYQQLWDDIKGYIASEFGYLKDSIDCFREQLDDVDARLRLLENNTSESTAAPSASDTTPPSTQKRKRKSDLIRQVINHY